MPEQWAFPYLQQPKPEVPLPSKVTQQFPTPWAFIPMNPTAMDGRVLS
jgi:hypothetical protein